MTSKIWNIAIGTALLTAVAIPAHLVAQEEQEQGTERVLHYRITDLGALPGSTFSQGAFVSNKGLIAGVSTLADGAQHAVIWRGGQIFDIGKPGLGGPNSYAGGANDRGLVLLQAETPNVDPNHENFCAYGTGLTCLAAVWHDGAIRALPPLGGYNSSFGGINDRSDVAGAAEENVMDPDCPDQPAVNGTGPQVLDFKPVIWRPSGEILELPLLSGDSVGFATFINDSGQAVGFSGSCADTILPPIAGGPHAVFWEKNGSLHRLHDFGGKINPAVLGTVNAAWVINKAGQVTGVLVLPDGTNVHAVLWNDKSSHPRDLGTLPGDANSAGLGLNNHGDVVGPSINGSVATGTPSAFVWHNGKMNDLNKFLAADSPFVQLLIAYSINDAGEIVGFGLTTAGDIHGFRASRCDANDQDAECRSDETADSITPAPRPALSENARQLMLQQLGRR